MYDVIQKLLWETLILSLNNHVSTHLCLAIMGNSNIIIK